MNYYLIDGEFISSDELYHYGVKGMKWGIRRYQNQDGTLTSEGKKRAKQEYKDDNKKAYELGKDATIAGHATGRSMRRTIKLENKLDKLYEKDPEGLKTRTQKLRSKWDASAASTASLMNTYAKSRQKAEEHCKSLIEKYGDEAVKSIKYFDYKLPNGKYSPKSIKVMNERVNKVSDYAVATGLSASMTALMQFGGAPVFMLYTPATADQQGRQIEYSTYRSFRKTQKNGK